MARTITKASLARMILLAGAMLGVCRAAVAQYSQVEVPFSSASSSFYENFGTRWGVSGRGWFFNFGGPGPGMPGVAPPFGGFDPNAQGNLGAGFRNGNVSGYFQLTAGQGSDRSVGVSAPSVVVPNGGQGFFSDTVQRPFVTAVIPIVGEPVSPLRMMLEQMKAEGNWPPAPSSEQASPGNRAAEAAGGATSSTADRGDLSVTEIRAAQAAEASALQNEIDVLVEKAKGLEEAGKLGVARIHYEMAARKATGDQQRELAAKARELKSK